MAERELDSDTTTAWETRPRNYEAGDWIAAPVGASDWLATAPARTRLAVGHEAWIAARIAVEHDDNVLLYVFPELLPRRPQPGDLERLAPHDAVHRSVWDLFIRGGLYPVLGHDPGHFAADRWPLPEVVRETWHPHQGTVHLAHQPHEFFDRRPSERRITDEEATEIKKRSSRSTPVGLHLELMRLAGHEVDAT